jgi:hypothetical protein
MTTEQENAYDQEYERGFAAGERRAWEERDERIKPSRPTDVEGAWHIGFWDARIPRSPSWALRRPEIKSFSEVE